MLLNSPHLRHGKLTSVTNGPCSRRVCQPVAFAPQSGSSSSVAYTSNPSPTTPTRQNGEHDFKLSEYMVLLEKPIGLTLAPDPATGQILVQSIQDGSPAAECGLIQVGDAVKMCSAVFGEDMWQAADIRRIRWAINNRTSKIKLVLERTLKPQAAPAWYIRGVVGRVSQERDPLQLPVSFTTASQDDRESAPSDMLPAPGKPLLAVFHACPSTTAGTQAPPRKGPAVAARMARLQALRSALSAGRQEPELGLGQILAPPPVPAANIAGNNSSAATTTTGTASNNVNAKDSKAKASSKSSGSGSGSSGPFGRLMESLAGGMMSGSNNNSSSSSTSNNNNNSSAANNSSSNSSSAESSGSADKANTSSSPAVVSHPSQHKTPRAGPTNKEKKVTPVLPWLLVSSCRLDTRDLTQIASRRGLNAVLELGLCRTGGFLAVRGSEAASAHSNPVEVNVSSFLNGSSSNSSNNLLPHTGAQPANAGTAGLLARKSSSSQLMSSESDPPPQSVACDQRYRQLIHAAASLQRLTVRRQHGTLHHSPPDACNILLHCAEPGMSGEVATLLAAWLHWYTAMPLQEAALSAEIALGVAAEQDVVQGATEALVTAAEERCNRVVLTWRYGGLSASVAGDVVGSWATRIPLMRCKNPMGCKGSVARGNFFIELSGLRPGVYYYKYIVDGTWAVDPASPKVLDASGNWNNVLEVHPRRPLGSTKERLAAARWHAAHLAWESKMGLRPAH